MNIVDQDGYQVVKRSRTLGHYIPKIFAVDMNIEQNNVPKSLLKKHLFGDRCAEEECDHRSCVGDVTGFGNPQAKPVRRS